jgi:hypothetical protein
MLMIKSLTMTNPETDGLQLSIPDFLAEGERIQREGDQEMLSLDLDYFGYPNFELRQQLPIRELQRARLVHQIEIRMIGRATARLVREAVRPFSAENIIGASLKWREAMEPKKLEPISVQEGSVDTYAGQLQILESVDDGSKQQAA